MSTLETYSILACNNDNNNDTVHLFSVVFILLLLVLDSVFLFDVNNLFGGFSFIFPWVCKRLGLT